MRHPINHIKFTHECIEFELKAAESQIYTGHAHTYAQMMKTNGDLKYFLLMSYMYELKQNRVTTFVALRELSNRSK